MCPTLLDVSTPAGLGFSWNGRWRRIAKTYPLGFICYTTRMPSILRFEGLRVVIYPNDHRPAHVHVIGKGSEAVFVLNCPSGPPNLRESYHFKASELNRIASALSAELLALCAKWREIHGNY
ncbi:DUF4160 domain-containing protein [Halomonas lysinitropha]|uniref:DUF4160 domain-containing protein n=1 Tax=Halomonas lysinitropha TaxID=2607506 RepID=UPI0038995BB0